MQFLEFHAASPKTSMGTVFWCCLKHSLSQPSNFRNLGNLVLVSHFSVLATQQAITTDRALPNDWQQIWESGKFSGHIWHSVAFTVGRPQDGQHQHQDKGTHTHTHRHKYINNPHRRLHCLTCVWRPFDSSGEIARQEMSVNNTAVGKVTECWLPAKYSYFK